MEIEFQKKWNEVKIKVDNRFGQKMDIEAILFVIGLQELGQNIYKLTKDQKLEIIHVAICALLEPFGFYEFEGRDKDGWPHWKLKKELPKLNNKEQERLIKQGIIDYLSVSLN